MNLNENAGWIVELLVRDDYWFFFLKKDGQTFISQSYLVSSTEAELSFTAMMEDSTFS